LKEDWIKIPPDYAERQKNMKKPPQKDKELEVWGKWKYYYEGMEALSRMERQRKAKEQQQN
jgi:hypothetical protein